MYIYSFLKQHMIASTVEIGNSGLVGYDQPKKLFFAMRHSVYFGKDIVCFFSLYNC